MTERIAFIGLGNMGTPMARRLLDANNLVQGFDISEQARARLADAGGHTAETAVDAADRASVIIFMLPNSEIVESVVEELVTAGVIAEGTLLIDMSSSEPLRTRALAERVVRAGLALVDAPVSGGVRGAEDGTLTIMLGASDASRDRAHSVLAALGKVVDCGEVGAGHAIKALNNLMSATHLLITSEVMEAGIKFGLDPAVMLEVFNSSSGRSGSTQNKWPNFVLPGTFDSGFGLRLMLKDMRIAAGLAEQLGAPLSLGAQAIEHWGRSAEDLPADADHTLVARWVFDHADPDDRNDNKEGAR